MKSNSDILVSIDDLSVWYKTFRGPAKVVDHLSLHVKEGEKVGIVGESGCGKTTTMKMIPRILDESGIIVPNGKILFKEQNILDMNEEQLLDLRRNKVSMISQLPLAALNPVITIGEQLMDFARYSNEHKTASKKELKDIAKEAITTVMIPDADRIMEYYPHQLSGGMRQRICIAASLISSRNLLIADEPGTALDVTVQDQIHRLLKDVVDEFNMSLIMITHSLGVIREQVDRVYVMYAGRVVEEAATSTLFNNPSHPYTKGLFDSVPKIRGGGLSEGIYGYVPDYVTIEDRCRFFDRCSLRQPICEQLGHPELVEIDNSHFVSCYVVSGTHADERKVVNG